MSKRDEMYAAIQQGVEDGQQHDKPKDKAISIVAALKAAGFKVVRAPGKKRQASDYKHIEAYGRFMGSFKPYIRRQQEDALADGAPLNATHAVHNIDITAPRVWRTIDDVTPQYRVEVDSYLS